MSTSNNPFTIIDDIVPEDVPQYGQEQGLVGNRPYKKGAWSPAEIMVLQAVKRIDYENHGPGASSRTQMTPASERWAAMEEEMVKRGVLRSKTQIQDKWEALSADFKKVHDYQKKIPSGRPSYFQMTSQEKRDSINPKFPKTHLDEGVFNALRDWYVKSSQAVDPGDLPIDMASMPRGGGNFQITIIHVYIVP